MDLLGLEIFPTFQDIRHSSSRVSASILSGSTPGAFPDMFLELKNSVRCFANTNSSVSKKIYPGFGYESAGAENNDKKDHRDNNNTSYWHYALSGTEPDSQLSVQ